MRLYIYLIFIKDVMSVIIHEGDIFDYSNFFEIRTKLKEENQKIILFDYDDEDLLPPTLYDLAALPEDSLILETTGNSQIDGTFVFDKSIYQPFFGITYLTGQLAVSTIDTFSYVLYYHLKCNQCYSRATKYCLRVFHLWQN